MCSPSTSMPTGWPSWPAQAARRWPPIWPTRPARDRVADAADGLDYLVNSARHHPDQADLRGDGRGLAPASRRSTPSRSSSSARRSGRGCKPGGAIVNLSSSSAKLATTIEVAAYAASKTTILSITRSFAYALAVAAGAGQRHLPRHHRHADAGRRCSTGVAQMRGIDAARA